MKDAHINLHESQASDRKSQVRNLFTPNNVVIVDFERQQTQNALFEDPNIEDEEWFFSESE